MDLPSAMALFLLECKLIITIPDYFTNIDGKLLPALVDRKLMDLMPDLIDMDYVHFDPCMLVIYYCILWQGLFFHKACDTNQIDNSYARQVFICCKRTIPIWQQEATGTVNDFIAAMYMVILHSRVPQVVVS